MRIHVAYRPNPEFYDEDIGIFNADYVYDLSALRLFVVAPDPLHGNHYSDDEAMAIIRAVDNNNMYPLEKHDKYTFYDTDWEREQVLCDDQNIDTADFELTVYLNS
jgi:hypothetical protein